MYIFEELIDLGLEEGQKWPSDAHRKVAAHLGLQNPRVTNKDALTKICQKVIAIPEDRIKSVTISECREEFEVPFI